jgi:hypothetical protein
MFYDQLVFITTPDSRELGVVSEEKNIFLSLELVPVRRVDRMRVPAKQQKQQQESEWWVLPFLTCVHFFSQSVNDV